MTLTSMNFEQNAFMQLATTNWLRGVRGATF
jgi:hypothetical protein